MIYFSQRESKSDKSARLTKKVEYQKGEGKKYCCPSLKILGTIFHDFCSQASSSQQRDTSTRFSGTFIIRTKTRYAPKDFCTYVGKK